MQRSYSDIISRISEPPLWWGKGGVPRYSEFRPRSGTDPHAKELALVEVVDRASNIRFLVLFEHSFHSREIAAAIQNHSLQYGDPPNVEGVEVTDPTDTVRVHQYWFRAHEEFVEGHLVADWARYDEWIRDPSLEVMFPDYESDTGGRFWSPQSVAK